MQHVAQRAACQRRGDPGAVDPCPPQRFVGVDIAYTGHHGLVVASQVIHSLFDALLDDVATIGAGLDWKTSLQELTAARGLGVPSYVVTSSGPDHDKEFTAMVVLMDTEYGSGVGRSKKEAEQKAAAAAWSALEDA